MHDLDRTRLETGFETPFESEQFDFTFEAASPAVYGEVGWESPLTEAEQMELAAELLTISNEEELDQFLGKLFGGIWRGIKKVGSFVGRVARPLGGILKGIAKKALPFVGSALGSFIPIPGVGTAVGGALGSALSKALEAELEGLSAEDREFETARRFVNLAASAARHAASLPPDVAPQAGAQQALWAALRQMAPAMASAGNGSMSVSPNFRPTSGLPAPTTFVAADGATGRSGRWLRRGRKIILYGV